MFTCSAEESTLFCFLATGRIFVSPPTLDLTELLTGMLCGNTGRCSVQTKQLRWYCAAVSEMSEAHSGYISFNTSLDYIICRTRDICFGKIFLYL